MTATASVGTGGDGSSPGRGGTILAPDVSPGKGRPLAPEPRQGRHNVVRDGFRAGCSRRFVSPLPGLLGVGGPQPRPYGRG